MKATKNKKAMGFSEEEKAAMKEYAGELVLGKGQGEAAVLEKIAQMPKADRDLAKRIHEIVKKNAPQLTPKTWYGMPAYANSDGNVICFFQNASKFKSRYATFGFNDRANLDEGNMWPTSFALKKLTPADEKRIATLVKKAVS